MICVECKRRIYGAEETWNDLVMFIDEPYHRGCVPRCDRCGDVPDDKMAWVWYPDDLAQGDYFVHIACMREGDRIA